MVEIEKHIKMLGSRKKAKRESAIEELKKIGGPAASRVADSLKKGSKTRKMNALDVLKEIATKREAPQLAEIFENKKEDGGIRHDALLVLSRVDSNKAADYIINSIKKKDLDTSMWILEEFTKYAGDGALRKLIRAHEEVEDELSREEILGIINRITIQQKDKELEMKKHIQNLKHGDGNVRRIAAEALGEIGHPDAVPGLIEALKDEHWVVRLNAATSLGEIGHVDAVRALIESLNDAPVRQRATEALGKMGPPAMQELIRLHENAEGEKERELIEEAIKILERKKDA